MMDIGGAVAQGITGYIQGQNLALDRQKKQQALTMAQEQYKQYKQQGPINQSILEQQLEQTQMVTKKLKDQLTKQDMWQAFDRGTDEDINRFLKTPGAQELFPGVQSIKPIDDKNLLYQTEGMAEPRIATMIVQGPDGQPTIQEKIIDLEPYKIQSGYATYKAKRDAELKASEVKEAKLDITSEALKKAVQSNDPTKVMEALKITNPELFIKATKPKTSKDLLNDLKLQKEVLTKNVSDYVNSNPKEVFETIKSSPIDGKIKINGQEVPVYAVAKQLQGDKKLGTARQDYLNGMFSTIKNMDRLQAKMASSKFDWDALTKGMDELSKISGTEWRNMSEKEKQHMLDRFSFDSDLRVVMAGYIKAMSGAAVSDQERAFYENAILGGNWSSKETALSAMKGFRSGIYNGYLASLEADSINLPATYLERKYELDQLHPASSTPQKPSNPLDKFWGKGK